MFLINQPSGETNKPVPNPLRYYQILTNTEEGKYPTTGRQPSTKKTEIFNVSFL